MKAVSDWRVLLIGGNSGAGKTHVSKALVRELGIPFLMVDDVRIALQQVTNLTQQQDLHVFLNYPPEQWKQPETIFTDWIRVGNAMIRPLREIMAHHIVVEGSGKLIVEGDGILPALADQSTFSDISGFEKIEINRKVQAVFLIEDDEKVILKNLRKRDRGISTASEEKQAAFARASWLYGQWLAREACTYQIPVLSPHPQETIVERLLETIG